ncbi:enoyl-CoA hydratase/isomerase family protein [Streptosporangium amethystogenes]|uniref:enoyl-CoA hydratase/isomerase family protein n=1 Tax=Streptosporangium amethystogenes TaxID=2002 RepID=UPI0004C4B384|nr:enoyl-CoA hydratase/isomerase family protein [Streptosporangium amethystogenes]
MTKEMDDWHAREGGYVRRPSFEEYADYFVMTRCAAINGPSVAHTEFALLCDITLAAESATIVDPHLLAGVAPGDGQQLTLQELIGTKRAAYHLYTGKPIGAQEALTLGPVNEVLAGDRLLPRAWELAETAE